MTETSSDDRGRLTLPKEIREPHGDRYYIGELHDVIKLILVDEDPLEALRNEFAGGDKSATELKKRHVQSGDGETETSSRVDP